MASLVRDEKELCRAEQARVLREAGAIRARQLAQCALGERGHALRTIHKGLRGSWW